MSRPTRPTRLRVILAVAQLLFGVLLVRLFQVQWAQSVRFDARSRQLRTAVTEKVKRGAVLDRNYRELALSRNLYSLSVYPAYFRELQDRRRMGAERVAREKNALAAVLARHTNRDADDILTLLNSARSFEWVQRRLEFSVIAAFETDMEASGLDWWPRGGVDYEVEERRHYPRGDLAAHVIGYTNVDGMGQEGVERFYDERLRSRVVETPTLKDARGRAIDPLAVAAEYPSNSESIVLTLDERIQYVLETELAGQCENFQAKSAVGIVMDPRTGEVFALANYPAYDLNRYNDPRIPPVLRRNRATWWPYEPGSAFKIVTLAALLDSGKITPDEPIFCENGLYKPHPRIKAIKDVHPYGTLTFAEVIQKSSNIGTLKAAQRLSQQEFRAYIHRFGLDSVTGVDLPYERRGNVAQVTDPRAYYGMFFVPWGQGVSVTPLQVLSALNVIANKGRLMRPHIVRETLDASGHVQERVQPVMVRQVISEAAAQAAAQILAGVVEKGTGTAARLEGVRVAGKTGTSQKASDERRGYLHGRYMSSFIGFFPVEEPRYSILILVDEPQGLHYGGQVAAPVFRQVAEKILAYETTRLLAGHLPKMPDGMDFSRYAGQAPLADDDPSKKDAMSLHPVAESGAP